MFTIICSTICRSHDRRAYSKINDQCVLQLRSSTGRTPVAVDVKCSFYILFVCVTLGPKAVVSRGDKIATAGGGVHFLVLTAWLIKFYGGLRLMKSTAA